MIRVAGEPVERKAVTEKLRRAVTKRTAKPVTEPAAAQIVTKPKGRHRVHQSGAERQKAYRERKKVR